MLKSSISSFFRTRSINNRTSYGENNEIINLVRRVSNMKTKYDGTKTLENLKKATGTIVCKQAQKMTEKL